MSRIKDIIAICAAKLTSKIVRTCHLGAGTNLPGRIALKISPDILAKLVNQSKEEIIAITGTNGKTTTAGFVAGILKSNGKKIAHNKRGANMLEGITTAVIGSSSIDGKLDVDHSLLESDEAYLPKSVNFFSPDILLVTNLFRDQLDRYGELDTTARKIKEAIDKTTQRKQLKLLLNVDDPMVSRLETDKNSQTIFYGFDQINFIDQDDQIKTPQEIVNCNCGKKLDYEKVFYGHLGHYECDCGYKRKNVQITATASIKPDSSELIVKDLLNDKTFNITISMPGIYNAYNALAAISVGVVMGIDFEVIKKGMENYSTVFGRAEELLIKEKPCLIQLIKNPIGATEVLRTVKDAQNARLLIIINDNYADGRDVSWLWDANFELLKYHKNLITVSGVRASDMAVRLKYAGVAVENIRIIDDIKEAINVSVKALETNEKLFILPTYTALLDMQKILKKL